MENESSFISHDSQDKLEVKWILDGFEHRTRNCAKFKGMKIDERYNVAKETSLCFCCPGDNNPLKDCPRNRKFGVDGCERHTTDFSIMQKSIRSISQPPRQREPILRPMLSQFEGGCR